MDRRTTGIRDQVADANAFRNAYGMAAQIQSDVFIVQTPSHLSPENLNVVQEFIRKGQPVALVGSFSDGIDEALLQSAGLHNIAASPEGRVSLCSAKNLAPDLVKNVPLNFNTYCNQAKDSASTSAGTIYVEEGTPTLTLSASDGKKIAAWDAPSLRSLEGIPLSKIWGNAGAPYALAAGVFNEIQRMNSNLHVDTIDLKQTMSIAAWRTRDGNVRILAGNLEEGLRDDAEMARNNSLVIPKSLRTNTNVWSDHWTGRVFRMKDGSLSITLPQASSVLLEQSR